jgi:hypothetical protein
VLTDIRRIRTHPLVPDSIPIYGYIYDVRTGRLVEVPGANALGKAARTAVSTSRGGRAAAAPGKKAAGAKKAADKKSVNAAKKGGKSSAKKSGRAAKSRKKAA